jgi:hypothetical protein
MAGCSYSFKLATEGANGSDLPDAFMGIHKGIVGDMTASKKLPSHLTNKLCNALSLEWFTPNFGMFLLQTAPEETHITAPEWVMDEDAEQAQKMVNKQVLRDYVQGWVDYYSHQGENADTDSEWDVKLRRAEGMAICYRVLYDKYYIDGGALTEMERQTNLFFALGWDSKLRRLAYASEHGYKSPLKVFPDLALLDGLNMRDLFKARRMCRNHLIRQIERITNMAKRIFQDQISREALAQEMPPDEVTVVFKSIRFLSTNVLSCLLRIDELKSPKRLKKRDSNPDTVEAIVSRLALCANQINDANEALASMTERDTKTLQGKLNDLKDDIMDVSNRLNNPS